nr:transposase, mutator type [Tanacetum cinerariifolium]
QMFKGNIDPNVEWVSSTEPDPQAENNENLVYEEVDLEDFDSEINSGDDEAERKKALRKLVRTRRELHLTRNDKERVRAECRELKERNLYTIVKIDVERDYEPDSMTRQFRRIYVCLGALKSRFKAGQRDLLGLDGCFMSGPFPMHILTAVGVDPNYGIYPLAYAIVESENKQAWLWFLDCLRDDLKLFKNSNFTFVTDRKKGFIPALTEIFPAADHRYCLKHIYDNMKLQWRGQQFKDLLWKCATATTVSYFNRNMEELKGANKELYDWLKLIPTQHWARSYFSVQQVICKSNGPLTSKATKVFEVIKKLAAQYTISWNGGNLYQAVGPKGDQCVEEMYRFKINPCNGPDLWPPSDSPITYTPAEYHKPAGRPSKKRKKSAVELFDRLVKNGKLSRFGQTVTCCKCGKKGHNSRTYKGQRGSTSAPAVNQTQTTQTTINHYAPAVNLSQTTINSPSQTSPTMRYIKQKASSMCNLGICFKTCVLLFKTFVLLVRGGIMVRNTSMIQDTNGWYWKFINNKQDSSIPIRNQFHKEVEKIASSFYITNFPDYVDAKRLWVECQSYRRIVYALLANKRSKAGKRFGFIRFLGRKRMKGFLRIMGTSRIESEYISDDESLHGAKNKSVGSQHGEDDLVDVSDVEGVSETFFGDKHPSPNNSVCNSSEKVVEQQSEDPFCIYDVLNKKPKGVAQDSDSSLSHPPGFILEVSRQENDHRGVDFNTETDKVNSPLVHTKVMNNSQKVHENVTSNGESAFNYSHNAHNGGSILEVLDDMIRVGQSIGYAMEGCMKDIKHVIGTQGVNGNSNYQYASSDSAGSSGGILCVCEATIFKKDYATVFDNFIAIYETWISNNSKVLIVVIYAPQSLSHKRVIWDYILSLITRWNGETIVMGDFNEVRCIDERFGSMFNHSSSRLFNHFITSSGLVDVKLEGYSFTWAHPSPTKMSKPDHFLVSKGIISLFLSIMALCLDRHLSDHRPILLREIHTDYGPIPFRFYHSWFKWDGFDVMVEQAWNSFSHSDTNGLIRFKKKL